MFSNFFSSIAFAIPALIIVGSSWCLVGVVMGGCPKHGIPAAAIQLAGGIFSCLISLIILMFASKDWLQNGIAGLWPCLLYFSASIVNFFMLLLMSKAMQRGPNGIIWAIIQSALIFPFIGGIAFFHMTANWVQWLGVCLIVGALFVFGLTKDNSVNYERKPGEFGWKFLTFCAFAIVAVQQNLATAPSYFPETASIPSIFRTLVTNLGTMSAFGLYTLCQKQTATQPQASLLECCRRPIFWKYIIALQSFGLISSYLLLYPSIDIMAKNNLGGCAYPMMVGSCIVAFSLLATFQMKERIRPLQLIGLLLCIAGLVGLCFK